MAAVCLLQLESASVEHTLMEAQENPAGGIDSVFPTKGPYRGNSLVTITGHQLCGLGVSDIAHVSIKGVKVDKVLSASPESVVVRTGSLEGSEKLPGVGDVAVVSHSKGLTKSKHLYEYKQAPLAYQVEPDNGAHSGGTEITIQGQNLCSNHDKEELTVQVCDQPAKNVKCVDSSAVSATTDRFDPEHSSGSACDVLVQSSIFGESKAATAFTYRAAPVITHIVPREGAFEGGNKIKILGSDLTSGKGRISEDVQVLMGGQPAEVLSYTPSTVEVRVPDNLKTSGFVAVEVSSKQHGTAKAGSMYRMHPQPVIKALSQNTGRANGGEHLTIFGQDLGRGDIEKVHIGGHDAPVVWADPNGHRIKVVTPQFEPQDENKTLRVAIKSRQRGHAKLRAFKVFAKGVIHSVSPRVGPAAGGTFVTITGENMGVDLMDYHLVKVNGVPASIEMASPERIVIKTKSSSPDVQGDITVYSKKHGITTAPPTMRFQYAQTSQLVAIKPAMSQASGGGLVILEGSNLCNEACDDLEFVQIGNMRISKFEQKTSRRVVVRAPSAEEAGGFGAKTVTVHSVKHGAAESPAGFLYLDGGSSGVIWPHDAPLGGSSTVLIEGDNLGDAEEYHVLLAGVEAKVLSASSHKIEVQVGDASQYAQANQLDTSEGLQGNVIIETAVNGVNSGMDTNIVFKYNAPCSIERVSTEMGPRDGDSTLVISGHHLGMGDERVYLDGKPTLPGHTVRTRQGNDVHELRVRASGTHTDPSAVAIKSRRSGSCEWSKAPSAAPAAPVAQTQAQILP